MDTPFCEILFLMLVALPLSPTVEQSWKKPGCFRVGHKRVISIPDCSDTVVVTNGCRGYCQSWSIPSSVEIIIMNPEQAITSMGQCCNIIDTEDISFRVPCIDGMRQITVKSATRCSCYHCKKE